QSGRRQKPRTPAQPAGPPQPAERALTPPTAWHHLEGGDLWRRGPRRQPAAPPATVTPHHDLQPHPEVLPDPAQKLAAVALVPPAVPQPRKPPPVHPAQQLDRAVTVADVG